jgi:EAL domain-containing protein (putative c-di-GMP-specific phosphodiesterase class I)
VTAPARPRLLVVDDEADMADFIREVAQGAGFEARAVTTGRAFRENYHPDLDVVVLDLLMPQVDGVELLRFLAGERCGAGVILVSGFDPKVLRTAKELAAMEGLQVLGTLAKPFQVDALRQLLARRPPPAATADPSPPEPAPTETALRRAIEERAIVPWFQPQVVIPTGTLAGVEALARWRQPDGRVLGPARFLPLARETGLIEPLTDAMLAQSVAQLAAWDAAGLAPRLSLNLEASSLRDVALPDRLARHLAQEGIAPDRLVVEITEAELLPQLGCSLEVLARLRMKGIGLSIDDFGTGYATLQQLRLAPFTELKIDRGFIEAMGSDAGARAIVEASLRLGHELGLRVVAEGVADEGTWNRLRDLGCDEAQGYFISPPMPADRLVPWMRGVRVPGLS